MTKFSTSIRTGMLTSTGAKTALQAGSLLIYGGATPTDADAAVTGTLLATLSNNGDGTGLNFDDAVNALLSKASAQIWKTNSVTTTGTGTYWRFVATGDDGTASTTAKRAQGTIGGAGSDMVMGNTTFTAGQPWSLNYFQIALPTL